LIAFSAAGGSVTARHPDGQYSPCSGGVSLLVEQDSHLAIDDPEFIASIQAELETKKRVSLSLVVDRLGIREKLQWQPVLDTGEYVFVRQLRRDWTGASFSAQIRYRKFIPSILVPVLDGL
jgi:hypothetical protein